MPPKKRLKKSKHESDDDSEVDNDAEAGATEAAAPGMTPGLAFRDKDGSRGWELGNKRRLTVTTFKGKQYIGLREYYEKDGKLLPGKKGINLTVEQYRLLLSLQGDIEKLLSEEK